MPHTTNIRAFRDADVGVPVFRLYTLLVAAELRLKDATARYLHTHDLDVLVNNVFRAGVPAALQSTLTNLQNTLAVLHCTRKGASVPVDPAVYPGLRYTRFQVDGFADPGSPDADVQRALQAANDFVAELRNAGVPL